MTELIIEAVARGGYFAIAVLMALENVFPPMPSEVIMGLGGVLVERGMFSFWPLLLAGTAGATAGNYLWFWIGHRWGYRRLKPFVDRRGRWLTLEWRDVEAVGEFFRKHGQWAVFFARFLPIFRTMISLPAGLAHMSKARFVVFTFAGSAIWNAVFILAGGFVQRQLAEHDDVIALIVGGLIAIAVLAYIYRFVTWQPCDER